mmetsp:Transcript_10663/g.19353  ORF Transcript_10663/g.19353 Transcript_10663/m.19353 type:complete len:200 (-) Transcript_10663:640-1239(-)
MRRLSPESSSILTLDSAPNCSRSALKSRSISAPAVVNASLGSKMISCGSRCLGEGGLGGGPLGDKPSDGKSTGSAASDEGAAVCCKLSGAAPSTSIGTGAVHSASMSTGVAGLLGTAFRDAPAIAAAVCSCTIGEGGGAFNDAPRMGGLASRFGTVPKGISIGDPGGNDIGDVGGTLNGEAAGMNKGALLFACAGGRFG